MARTAPTNPERFNGLFIANNFGAMPISCRRLEFGIHIVSREARGRHRQAFYVDRVTGGAFDISLSFADHIEYEDFYKWMLVYALAVTNPDSNVGPMYVLVPDRGFGKVGYPTTGLTFGDSFNAVKYGMDIHFEGTSEPLVTEAEQAGRISYWVGAKQNTAAPYYDPSGVQLGGKQDAADSLYGGTRTQQQAIDQFLSGVTINPTTEQVDMGFLGTWTIARGAGGSWVVDANGNPLPINVGT